VSCRGVVSSHNAEHTVSTIGSSDRTLPPNVLWNGRSLKVSLTGGDDMRHDIVLVKDMIVFVFVFRIAEDVASLV
jgi:hypothetical protein